MELHLTNPVPDEIVKALCTTLIHSLWEGLILAAVTGLTIVLTKKASAALRYNLMIGFLILFSAAITFTFVVQLHLGVNKTASPIAITANIQAAEAYPIKTAVAEQSQSILINCINYFNMHSDTVVLIWFLIICARGVQFASGLHAIYHIKRVKVLSAGSYWDNKIAGLSYDLGIKRTVQLMQSGIAKLPMVVGHFKPVILIPIGLLTALSTEEVESVLVHELAHIQRRDYLVNLLQNLMEIVFFFNPAVLWVSALIKEERENCCDDIAVAQTKSKVNYIRALVSCHEYRSAKPAYAMGLAGNSDHFLKRVKRMVSNNNQSLNRVEKMVLTVCLISALVLTAAFSKNKKENLVIRPQEMNTSIFSKDENRRGNVPGRIIFKVNNIKPGKKENHEEDMKKTGKAPSIPNIIDVNDDTLPKRKLEESGLSAKTIVPSDPPVPLKYKLLYTKIADELLRENLIKDKNNFSYRMTAHKLVIDGVEQQDEIHRRILEKFVKEPDDDLNLVYSYNFHY